MLITVYILTAIIGIYILLLWITPKATILHEFLHLPIFWFHTLRHPLYNIKEEKIHYGPGKKQYFLFIEPKQKKKTRKNIILYFHGGGWAAGKPEMFRSSAQVFANEGFITVCGCHRKTPFHSYPHMREDITLCMTKLMEVLKDKGLDNKNIILGGMSAGANLASLLLYNRVELAKTGCSREKITGIFLCAGPLDLNQMPWTLPLHWYAGSKKKERFQHANPIFHIQEDEHHPVLLIHGQKDGLVTYQSSVSFYEKITQINPDLIEFHTIERGSHLNAADWGYQDNSTRKVLIAWIEKTESSMIEKVNGTSLSTSLIKSHNIQSQEKKNFS